VSGVTYDTGVLLAAERDDRRVWLLHRRSLQRGVSPTVPAGVIGQSWRGSHPRLARLLAGCQVEALSGPLAKRCGALLAAAGTMDVIDASVVLGALARGDAVLTSDRSDLEALAAAARRRLGIVDV
jgi:hypothetical protein